MTGGTLAAAFSVERGGFRVAVELTVAAGRPLALVGPNGAGKSTVLTAIAGLIPLASGSLRVGERTLADAEGSLPAEERRVGMVFQDFALFPHLTVRDNVAFARRVRVGLRAARAATAGWLAHYDLDTLADRYPAELSGGQAQRVALARALAADPEVLLLDEPMASLDVETRDEVRAGLADHVREFGGATIIVTHSFADAEGMADRVAVLEHGAITQYGTPDDLRRSPATPYVARLVRRGE